MLSPNPAWVRSEHLAHFLKKEVEERRAGSQSAALGNLCPGAATSTIISAPVTSIAVSTSMATTWCCPAPASCGAASLLGTPCSSFTVAADGLTGTSASDTRSPKPWAKITLTSCDSLKPVFPDGVVSSISAGPVGLGSAPASSTDLSSPLAVVPTTAAEAKGLRPFPRS